MTILTLPYTPKPTPAINPEQYLGGYRITQAFDENPQYYRQFGLPGHEGVDIGLPSNTPLLAVCKATVTKAESNASKSAYGREIRITWSDNGVAHTFSYAHCKSIVATLNSVVEQGQLIAYSNNTGNSTGPHLHVNMIVQGQVTTSKNGGKFPAGYVDPMPYLLNTVETPVPYPDAMQYQVIAPQGVRVRMTPNGKIITTLPYGTVVWMSENGAGDGSYAWLQLAGSAMNPQLYRTTPIQGYWMATGTVKNPNDWMIKL